MAPCKNGINNALPTSTALSVGGTYDLNGFNQTLTAAVTGSGTITDSGIPSTLTPASNSVNYTLNALISGNLSLVKSGSSTVTLGHADTYGGSTSINTGTLAGMGRTTPCRRVRS